MAKKVTRIGIGGPVGSGKTAIVEAITPRLLGLGVKVLIITNDVVTTEDAKHVQRTLKGVLLEERILGVETGACPHTAVREDPSMNLAAVEEMEGRFPDGGHGAGAVSNCMTCHRRASFPAVDFLPITRGEPDLAGDPAYAPGRLRTGMLWSIALHARP